MSTRISRSFCMVAAALVILSSSAGLYAQGHYAPGVPSIRDQVVPKPGFYGILYNYWYRTNQLNDSNGNATDSILINPGPGPGISLDLEVDVDIYAMAPTFVWVADWKVAGANYAAYITPTFASSSIAASLSTTFGGGLNPETDQFAAGDLFVQPVWLGWTTKKLDVAAGYGFYAPVGEYNVRTVDIPVVGAVKVTAPGNVGLGYWTHQFQGSLAYYPWENRAMALTSAWTYEINGNQEEFDLTPGSYFTWNWGLSQYLPITRDQKLLLEVGPTGYSQWQVSDDTGSDARNPTVHDQAHAAGFQAGFAYVPWNFAATFRFLNEFSAKSRFEGSSYGFNLALKL